ncbi:MAG: hypothetical protein R3B38_02105, partial [Patescibacteria group bacterium]
MAQSPTPVLFIEANSDISEVLDQIAKHKADELILSFPHQALALQNHINVTLLNTYATKLGKKITIASTDPVARKLVELANIPLHALPKHHHADVITAPEPSPIEEEESEATESEPEEEPADTEVEQEFYWKPDNPTPPAQRPNYGGNPRAGFKMKTITPTSSQQDWEDDEDQSPVPRKYPTQLYLPKFEIPKLSFKLTRQHKVGMAIIGAGLVILGTVSFFILPKADVVIEVQSEAFQKQFTISLVDETDVQAVGPSIIPGRFIEVTREHVATFKASGQENKGDKASGQINVVNRTEGIQGILANTRFTTESGLVFRIKNEVLVPPARGSTPGRAVVEAEAESGGVQYNVTSPLTLTIPNLSDGLKPLLYGEVVGSFTGGTDNIVGVVSNEDIDAAKQEAAKNVFVSAETELAKQATRNEQFNPAFIQNDVIDAVPSVTPGAEQEDFEIRVQSRSWTIVIPKDAFQEALSNAASFEVDPDKQVTDRTLSEATIEPVESSFINHQINLVVGLTGRVGPRLEVDEIRNQLMRQDIPTAEGIIKSL